MVTILPEDTRWGDLGSSLGSSLGTYLGKSHRNKKLSELFKEVSEENKDKSVNEQIANITQRVSGYAPAEAKQWISTLENQENRRLEGERTSALSEGKNRGESFLNLAAPLLEKDAMTGGYTPESSKMIKDLYPAYLQNRRSGMDSETAFFEGLEAYKQANAGVSAVETPTKAPSKEKVAFNFEQAFKGVDEAEELTDLQKSEKKYNLARKAGIPREVIDDLVEGKIDPAQAGEAIRERKAIKELRQLVSPNVFSSGKGSRGLRGPAEQTQVIDSLRSSGKLFTEGGVSALTKSGLPELVVRGILGVTRKAEAREIKELQRRYNYNADKVEEALQQLGLTK